jgi:peptidoglycan hydrolase-like protein with peptidoglycan-binding domain
VIPEAPEYGGEPLREGAFGDDVALVQGRLVVLGYAGVDVDGDFGPRTSAAVRGFQRDWGLDDDGVVGALTWNALSA